MASSWWSSHPGCTVTLFLSLGLAMFPLLGRTLPYFCLVYSAVVALRWSSLRLSVTSLLLESKVQGVSELELAGAWSHFELD